MSDAYLLFIGKDKGFLFGVPARNLTFEEASIHGEKRLIDSGLYKLAYPKEHKTYIRRSRKDIQEEDVNNG